jgi:glutamate synthase (NADPH/NADH) large chain
MLMLAQDAEFTDLMDERFEFAFAIYHQRYSTNTFPQWWFAQPFRMLAHNGEINTLKGNLNWMKSIEIRMASGTLVTWPKISNRCRKRVFGFRRLDAVFEVLVRGPVCADGKDDAGARKLVKQATELPQRGVICEFVLQFGDGTMGRACCACDDRWRWVCAGPPQRTSADAPCRDGDRLLIAGSEAGHADLTRRRRRERRAWPRSDDRCVWVRHSITDRGIEEQMSAACSGSARS